MTMFVKVVSVPGPVAETALGEGATVREALRAANLAPSENHSVTLNGSPTTMDAIVHEGDRVICSLAAKSAA